MFTPAAVRSGLFLVLFSSGASGFPEELRERLASDDFRSREEAQGELAQWARDSGADAVGPFIQSVLDERDPEVRARGIEVLRALANEAYLKEDGAEGYLGVSLREGDPVSVPDQGHDRIGFQVSAVTSESPAEQAGMKAGDVILSVEERTWSVPATREDLITVIRSFKPGDTVRLGILREGEVLRLEAVLTRRAPSLNLPVVFEGMRVQLLPNGQLIHQNVAQEQEIEDLERADRERFFRKWLRENKPGE